AVGDHGKRACQALLRTFRLHPNRQSEAVAQQSHGLGARAAASSGCGFEYLSDLEPDRFAAFVTADPPGVRQGVDEKKPSAALELVPVLDFPGNLDVVIEDGHPEAVSSQAEGDVNCRAGVKDRVGDELAGKKGGVLAEVLSAALGQLCTNEASGRRRTGSICA